MPTKCHNCGSVNLSFNVSDCSCNCDDCGQEHIMKKGKWCKNG